MCELGNIVQPPVDEYPNTAHPLYGRTLEHIIVVIIINLFFFVESVRLKYKGEYALYNDKSTSQSCQADVVLEQSISNGICVTTTPWHKQHLHLLDLRSRMITPYAMTV